MLIDEQKLKRTLGFRQSSYRREIAGETERAGARWMRRERHYPVFVREAHAGYVGGISGKARIPPEMSPGTDKN